MTSKTLYQTDLKGPVALVLGAEGDGIRHLTAKTCDELISIPMLGAVEKIDKMSTALGTDDNKARPYRYGYGVLDENLNMIADSNEKKVYFEISDYATNYVFFENPH